MPTFWPCTEDDLREILPRALSVDREDQRWRDDAMAIARCLVVQVNGVEQSQVVTYDMDEGFILRAKTDATGALVTDRNRGEVVMERLTGAITLGYRPNLT